MQENKNLTDNKVRRNRLFILSIVIILIGTMMPSLFIPSPGKIEVKHIDKIAHYFMFIFFSINICFKYHKDKRLIDVMIWAIFFGLMTEVIQQFIPGRDMDIYDGITDVVGIISGYYIYHNFQNKIDKILVKFGA